MNYVKVKKLDGTYEEIDLDTCTKYEVRDGSLHVTPPRTMGEDGGGTIKHPRPKKPPKRKRKS